MALSSTMVWEIRTAGNSANPGGFNPSGSSPGTDYSQQNGPQVTIDGATITATVHTTTTQLNITGYTVATTDNRNTVKIAGGTMTAGTYEITAVDTVNNRWTLDRSGGTAGQTGTGRMGGANSDPALIAAILVASNTVHQKSGTYTVTSTTANVAGGRVSLGVQFISWYGYNSTRQDYPSRGSQPELVASGISSSQLFTTAHFPQYVECVSVDGASLTSMQGFVAGQLSTWNNCHAQRCPSNGFNVNASVSISCMYCSSRTCGTGFNCNGNSLFACVATGCTTVGFTGMSNATRCIAYNNTGATVDGFVCTYNQTMITNCISYGNGRHGFSFITTYNQSVINSIAVNNGGWGIRTTIDDVIAYYNATYNNTSGATSSTVSMFNTKGNIALSGDPFTNAGSADFSLNNTSGAGAACRAAGFPSTFVGGTTSNYVDVGAAQHQDSPAVNNAYSFAYIG